MPRTAPAPNVPAIPGMCPGVAMAAGKGGSGGKKGKGSKKGAGKKKAPTKKQKKGAGSGRKNGRKGQSKTKAAADPVDAITGRVFTFDVCDLELPGPLPFTFERMYSTAGARRDVGLGYGWSHSYGWEIEVHRRYVTVWTDEGSPVEFAKPEVGDEEVGDDAWLLRRERWGFALDIGDGLWRLFSVCDAGGRRYRLTAIEDRNHNRIALTYDAADLRLLDITDSAGRIIKVESAGKRIRSLVVVSQDGGTSPFTSVEYQYDDRGDLVAVTDAEGHTARFRYTERHLLTEEADRTGMTFHFTYDSAERCLQAWGDYPGKRDESLAQDLPRFLADGSTPVKGLTHCRFIWYPDGSSEVVDTTQIRRYGGNEGGTVDLAAEGGSVMTAEYDDYGQLASETDGLGATTEYERDPRGRVTKITNPLGNVQVIERDTRGLPTRWIDANGSAKEFTYDAAGNLILDQTADGAVTTYAHDSRGLMTEIVEPNGARTTFDYDARGNVVAMHQPNGGVWQWTYDFLGRRLSSSDPLGQTTRFQWSPRGDLISITDPMNATRFWEYDGEHHIVREVDKNGLTRTLVWGGYHKICGWTDSTGSTVRFLYNYEGELVEVRNGLGQVHRYQYDPYGKVIAEETFDGRLLHYSYDPVARLIALDGGDGKRIVFTYDLAGNLLAREYHDGELETFVYDKSGVVIAATNSSSAVTFERDRLGRVVRETIAAGPRTDVVDTKLDVMGRRVGLETTYGKVEAILRDAMGSRVSTTLGLAAPLNHAIDALGRETAIRLSSNGVVTHQFDPREHLVRKTATKAQSNARPQDEPEWMGANRGNVTAEVAWTRNVVGDVVAKTDLSDGQTRYRYDAIGRLLEADSDRRPAEHFRWDAAENVYPLDNAPPVYDTRNRLVRRGDVEYTWDDDGRLIQRSRWVDGELVPELLLTWNAAGYLTEVEREDGTRVSFAYDAFGRRLQKLVRADDGSEQVTNFVWSNDLVVHEVDAVANQPVRTFTWSDLPFEPLAHADGDPRAEWFYYLTDEVGTPEKLLDGAGEVAADLEHVSVWGGVDQRSTRTSTPLRFAGQYADAETGLFYNRFRYYEPDDARYISPDPIGLEGGLNPFAYVSNPLFWIDPLAWDWNYRLVDSGGTPYYYGRAADTQSPSQVMYRHQNSKTVPGGRMGTNDRMEQLTPRGTGEARVRGVEDQGIQNGGPNGTSTLRQSSGNRRGNRIRGVNPNRNDPRARQFNAAGRREAHAGNMSNMPPVQTAAGTPLVHNPNDPAATHAQWANP